MTITAPTTVTITGVTASSTQNNILLDATIPTADGSGTQEVATNPERFTVVSVAIPVNFQTNSESNLPDGSLVFIYTWQSSSGNLQDLASCVVGESVFYPGTDPTYTWPAPMVQTSNNPTTIYGPGNSRYITTLPTNTGSFHDQNWPPGSYSTPYFLGEPFDATQQLRWSCPNYNNGGFYSFVPNIDLNRKIYQDANKKYWYQISKSGYTNTAQLPNQ
jgi:hypothetical protein